MFKNVWEAVLWSRVSKFDKSKERRGVRTSGSKSRMTLAIDHGESAGPAGVKRVRIPDSKDELLCVSKIKDKWGTRGYIEGCCPKITKSPAM